ncbi:Arc family DNA-binding protein [Alicycliphilus denitrificans]|nr:Arc family DNA-binding protein [Alicycliphilus denitrificans]
MNIQNQSIKPEPMRPDSIRIPAELRTYLREQARKNTRSYSGEVVHRLEASRQADQQPTTTKEST